VFNLCAKCVQNSRLDIKITPLEEKSSNFIHLTRYHCSTTQHLTIYQKVFHAGERNNGSPAFNHIFTHYDFPGCNQSRGSLFIS